MGLYDDYRNEGSFGKGPHKLTVFSFKQCVSKSAGTPGVEIEYFTSSMEHKAKKWIWKNKMFNRMLTSWLVQLGLNPDDLEQAARDRQADEWLERNVPGRSGTFEFVETDKLNDKGKPFLEPRCKAEIDLDEWIKSQKGNAPRQSSSEPPIDSYQGMASSDGFVDDTIPF